MQYISTISYIKDHEGLGFSGQNIIPTNLTIPVVYIGEVRASSKVSTEQPKMLPICCYRI